MTSTSTVLVVGASGFVGSAVVRALEADGHRVTPMRAPRLPGVDQSAARSFVESSTLIEDLASRFSGCISVINAAGNPDASSRDVPALTAANGVLPGLLAAAAARCPDRPRFVHVSSAVVQGRTPVLDASTHTEAFSAYAASKILGEELVSQYGANNYVIYRPPSVHALDRRVTRMIGKIAASPLATVAAPGSAPSPQALLPNVASAIAFFATCPQQPPGIVTHPWEGLTTSTVMEVLGGRRPRAIPRPTARAVTRLLLAAGKIAPAMAANARRVELLWFGQAQAESWLTEAGWSPPAGRSEWESLGRELRQVSTGIRERERAGS